MIIKIFLKSGIIWIIIIIILKLLVNNKEIIAKLMGINESGQLNCFHGEKIHAYNINEVKIIKDEFYAIDFGHTNYKVGFLKTEIYLQPVFIVIQKNLLQIIYIMKLKKKNLRKFYVVMY